MSNYESKELKTINHIGCRIRRGRVRQRTCAQSNTQRLNYDVLEYPCGLFMQVINPKHHLAALFISVTLAHLTTAFQLMHSTIEFNRVSNKHFSIFAPHSHVRSELRINLLINVLKEPNFETNQTNYQCSETSLFQNFEQQKVDEKKIGSVGIIRSSDVSLTRTQHNWKVVKLLNETPPTAPISVTLSEATIPTQNTRRQVLQSILAVSSVLALPNQDANAGIAEIDATGNLYTPINEMRSGGSQAARGIPVQRKEKSLGSKATTSSIQSIYEVRFVTYLSRFLLNYDPSARAWWVQQGVGASAYSWDSAQPIASAEALAANSNSDVTATYSGPTEMSSKSPDDVFAEFSQSVEFGLSDYFSGPFGSYSSVTAAIAGLDAAQPATSRQSSLQREFARRYRPTSYSDATNDNQLNRIIEKIFNGSLFPFQKNLSSSTDEQVSLSKRKQDQNQGLKNTKQGILNLYALLKARYNSISAKRQLAILFSFVTAPSLQPINEICSLLGEIDNATISKIQLVTPLYNANAMESESRTSPRRGGGYSIAEIPTVTIDGPAPLGDSYRAAQAKPVMKETSRILRINLIDGGDGYYSTPPVVTIIPWGAGGLLVPRPCQAVATLDREGHVDSIVVLDPGWGYEKHASGPPKVRIEAPTRGEGKQWHSEVGKSIPPRRAKAVAELEYAIVGIDLMDGGNGYVSNEVPKIAISPPLIDPDWFLMVQEQPEMRMIPVPGSFEDQVYGVVTEMKFPDGNIAYSVDRKRKASVSYTVLSDDLIERVRRDPLELLPSSIRPERIVPDDLPYPEVSTNSKLFYSIPPISEIPQYVVDLSPRYRACDPLFGGVGKLPVIKSASMLSASEYGRLALSGALCTVLVRTALNPLELIKTKLQLSNDDELFEYARIMKERKVNEPDPNLPRLNEMTVPEYNYYQPKLVSRSTIMTITRAEVKPLNVTVQTVVDKSKSATEPTTVGTVDLIKAIIELRGPQALFQSADITFLASIMFGSFGFGSTELFRRSFTAALAQTNEASGGVSSSEIVLLLAASLATIVTAAAAAPFELLRVRSMGTIEAKKWTTILEEFLMEKRQQAMSSGYRSTIAQKGQKLSTPTLNLGYCSTIAQKGQKQSNPTFDLKAARVKELLPLWRGFAPTVSRELPFAIAKFLTFDLVATTLVQLFNAQILAQGGLPIQVGSGTIGLAISAFAGAIAGIAGAIVSHPADLILTKTSARSKTNSGNVEESGPAWIAVVKEIIGKKGGVSNLFVGLDTRCIFFFLVIGLQFFLYDYVKTLFQVGSDDLNLVLDIFYAVRAGLAGM